MNLQVPVPVLNICSNPISIAVLNSIFNLSKIVDDSSGFWDSVVPGAGSACAAANCSASCLASCTSRAAACCASKAALTRRVDGGEGV